MPLIKSISGIRGTIGGRRGENLTPFDIVKYTAAFANSLKRKTGSKACTVVVGRDGRVSGEMVNRIVSGTLLSCGVDIIDLGMVSTPTVEIAVKEEKASGGIIITASHNPANWNALKLLDSEGEFISEEAGLEILKEAENDNAEFCSAPHTGKIKYIPDYTTKHINKILELPLVDKSAVAIADFRVLVDGINSVGGPAVKSLLQALGVKQIIEINNEPDGNFAHNPEPLPENLTETAKLTVTSGADFGIVVDPDVDRLCFICEDGSFFGEEYTLVAVADYVLSKTPGNTVSNLSSTSALKDITLKYGGTYYSSAVGEVNVVKMMKETGAVTGGEGNGGVIYPALHYGRDALMGIALFLTSLAHNRTKCSALRKNFPDYFIAKNKIETKGNIDFNLLSGEIKRHYPGASFNTTDGLRIDTGNEWIHLRKSNTEPVIRIYAESTTIGKADELAREAINIINQILVHSEIKK